MPKWTPDQENAINARNSNILVSAAAGSGKTAVLVERVIKLICDDTLDAGIDKLLIVTFTNAAAAEMKNRISSALYEIIKKEPNNVNAINQLALVPSAKICTIDSFCINLVRENFFKLDIGQDFSILDKSEELLIEQNAIDEIIEEHYQSENEEFKALVELLSAAKNDDDLIKAIKMISSFLSAQAFPIDWLRNVCEFYNPEFPIDVSALKTYVFKETEEAVSYIRGIIDECLLNLESDDLLFEKYSSLLEGDLEMIDNIIFALEGDWDGLKNAIESVSFSRMPYKRGYTSPSKFFITDRRNLYKSIIDDLKKLDSPSSEEFQRDNEYLYPMINYLCNIVEEYRNKMMEMKREMNSFTFSDIEHFAIDLLFEEKDGEYIQTDLAKDMVGNFYEILVDEYQDTNSAQDMLFSMLSNGKNRFMVGDIKQSIYRFRLAMPMIFNQKKDTFVNYSADSPYINQKIILDKNFRSRKGICDYTNFVFSKLMSKKIGELDYGEEDYLNCGAEYEESNIPSAQINIIQTPDEEKADEYEARQIAKLILDKIKAKEQIKDGDTYRDVRFSDFAILLRYTKNRIDVYSKILSEYSIPVSANNKINLFDNNEVSILVNLLRVIDNPTRDVPLLATLMSVFYGYSADDIAKARLGRTNENLYTSICAHPETFGKFIEDIDKYRKYASSMSVESFLRMLLSSTSFLSLISSMGNAEQRRLNVFRVLELAHNFDNGENVGITAFMRYIDSIISSDLNVDSASVVHSKENCVTIMSVHQSKGLEFPICIFASTSHKYNSSDLSDLVLMNHEMGIGLKINEEELLIRYNSLQYDCIKNINSCASMSENLRLLYVAITRAKEQFISFISLDNPESTINNLSKKIIAGYISPYIVKHTIYDSDLLIMTALLHPDGEDLRQFCEGEIEIDSSFDFKMKIDFLSSETEIVIDKEEEALPDEKLVKQIEDKLSFSYERSELSSFTSKRSASALDERERGFKYFAKSKPAFLSNSELTAAQKGTAMHTFMQYCDYERAKDNLENEISRLLDLSYLTDIQANSLSREKLGNFFAGDFAKRMFESDKIYREIRVASFVKASELENTCFDDEILVQGIADCVFEENGELVLVDYKTDYVKSEDELLELYKNQISFYKNAVSKALGKPVKEAMLYSFCLDKPCLYK